MCGIVGVWSTPEGAAQSLAALEQMTAALVRRGPDGGGTWRDDDLGLGLGHRRLAIIDTSTAGQQPMVSASGRYVIVFNGEVYNFSALRAQLQSSGPIAWRGGSDTEVMLAAFDRLGVEAAVREFVGMFAFAVWDREERTLHLVRDRLGVKPLLLAELPHGLAFSSDLFALRRHPRLARDLDAEALATMVVTGCVPGERTAYRSVRRVQPGTIVTLREPSVAAAEVHAYWRLREVAVVAGRSEVPSIEEATERVEAELDQCVAQRMVADVPLGAFLSGGIDSSLVVASMVRSAGRGVRTFALGHDDPAYDESEAAARVAAVLGTTHTRLVPTESEVLEAALAMPGIYDEPFADSSQIATYLVARLARAEVKVALSGDGGDELFFGYNRYRWGPHVWSAARYFPAPVRRGVARLAGAVGERGFDRLHRALGLLAPDVRLPGRQALKLLHAFAASSPGALYAFLRSVSPASRRLVSWAPVDFGTQSCADATDLASAMRLCDLERYLPDDVMTKVDRATMAVGLEAREPLLDHRLVELALAIPRTVHMHGGTTKAVLRRILARRLPGRLFDRPKMGFAVPIAAWLRGPLRAWAADMLASRALVEDGVVDTGAVRALWAAHLHGPSDHADALWPVVMYAAWRQQPE